MAHGFDVVAVRIADEGPHAGDIRHLKRNVIDNSCECARYRRAVPEGHTIRRLAERHAELFGGRPVRAASPQGRFEAGAKLIDKATLVSTEAKGKHLLHHYDRGLSLHVHLGLYGKFADGDGPVPTPVGQIRLRLSNPEHWLELRGPTACELFDPAQVAELLARLGADPLRPDSDPGQAWARISRSPTPIAALLLDQSVVAGTGLIFVLETVFRAGLSPLLPGRQVKPATWQDMWADLQEMMGEAVKTGRIDTVHMRHMPEAMGRAPRVDRHGGEVYVYRRAGQPCLICGTPIARGELAGRNLYWCPTCQPTP